jgi:hypothetical protein
MTEDRRQRLDSNRLVVRTILHPQQHRERIQPHVLVQRSEIRREVLRNTERARWVDARQRQEQACSIRPRKPSKVGDVVRLGCLEISARSVHFATSQVTQDVRPVVLPLELESRISPLGAADRRRQPWPADHDQAVPIQIELTAQRNLLKPNVEPKRSSQLANPIGGTEVFRGNDWPSTAVLKLFLERRSDDDLPGTKESTLRRRTAVAKLVDSSPRKARLVRDLCVRQPLVVEILNHMATQPGQLGDLLLRGRHPLGCSPKDLEGVSKLSNPFGLVRHASQSRGLDSALDSCLA